MGHVFAYIHLCAQHKALIVIGLTGPVNALMTVISDAVSSALRQHAIQV